MKRIRRHSPNGWFKVVFSDELAVGDVRAIHQFGRPGRVPRRDGLRTCSTRTARILGAHLGVGGKVVGNSIQCPFHGWR
jgi:phenylpropionate dioxygenase-like ring-hydroxylating dioxygenase large terminal subunit